MKSQLPLTGYCFLMLQCMTINSLADVCLSHSNIRPDSVLVLQLQSFKPTSTHLLNSMKQATAVLLLVATTMHVASAAVKNFNQKYPCVTSLDEGFKLYWKYDLEQQTIDFGCNISTNGWFSFGISPDSKMLHSDIVVGWVNSDGSAQFHVSI